MGVSTMTINQSLAQGLDILFLYDTDVPLLTASEVSRRLEYTQSKTYRLIRTLIEYGLLQQNLGTSQYRLGLNAMRLGLLAQRSISIPEISRPFMKELSLVTRETVLLTTINGTKGIVLERVESEEPVRYSLFQPGATIPLHAGASSKVLMAFLPEKEWDPIIAKEGLKRYTPRTITEVSRLKAHLREIRRKGYAFSDEEVDRGVRAIAAPIFNGIGECIAGLSYAGPAFRINKKTIGSCGRLVIEYAEKISSQMGSALKLDIERGNRRKRGANHVD